MKLTTLHEARLTGQTRHSPLEKVMKMAKQFKPDITVNELAWFAASEEASYTRDYNTRDMAHLFYDGYEALKDNPEHVNRFFEIWFEGAEDMYDEGGPHEQLEKELRKFFGSK